jgi:hypothetical protein
MIVDLKYFYENSDSDFEEYDKLWDANRNRMIFFQQNLSSKQQGETIVYNIDESKDILSIRFPNKNIFKKSRFFFFFFKFFQIFWWIFFSSKNCKQNTS